MSRTACAMYRYLRLGRPYYVLPVVASTFAGYWSSVTISPLCMNGGLVCLVFLLLGMACWGANEITDRRSDSRGTTKNKWGLYVSGGTTLLSSGLVSIKAAATYVAILAMLGLGISVVFGIMFWFLSVLFVLIGFAYSLRPVRLKERGILGLASVAAAYGVVAFTAGWVAGGQSPSVESVLISCILSVAFFGFEGIAHILDHDQDRLNDETTFSVSLGKEKARNILAICQCLPAPSLVVARLFTQSTTPRVIVVLFFALVVVSAITAALTVQSRRESVLSSLRVLSVPLMAAFALLVAWV